MEDANIGIKNDLSIFFFIGLKPLRRQELQEVDFGLVYIRSIEVSVKEEKLDF